MAKPWRTEPLPSNWQKIRSAVLKRDKGVCQIKGPGCRYRATEVDHMRSASDHSMEALQSACPPCHAAKTGREARAKQGYRRREPEAHPGMVNDA